MSEIDTFDKRLKAEEQFRRDADTENERIYLAGHDARRRNDGKASCPYGMADIEKRCRWLAGWGDADIAIREREMMQ